MVDILGRGGNLRTIPRVLFVDDEPGPAELISSFLTAEGMEVVNLDSGEAVIPYLEADYDFDLIILDYLMVGLNGMEILEMIKSDTITRDLKVVILSGLSDAHDMERAKNLGAIGYLLKPIKLGELANLIKNYISK